MLTFNKENWRKFPNWGGFRSLPVPGWQFLNQIRLADSLKLYWVFTVIVPIFAFAVSQFPESIEVTVLGQSLSIRLSFPFTWSVMYFAGVSFAIGGSILQLNCPRLIQDFPRPREIGDGTNISTLEAAAYVSQLFSGERFPISNHEFISSEQATRAIWNHYGGPKGEFSMNQAHLSHPTSGVERFSVILNDPNTKSDLLHRAHVFASYSRYWARLTCVLFFLLGSIFVGYVLFQNFVFVASTTDLPTIKFLSSPSS